MFTLLIAASICLSGKTPTTAHKATSTTLYPFYVVKWGATDRYVPSATATRLGKSRSARQTSQQLYDGDQIVTGQLGPCTEIMDSGGHYYFLQPGGSAVTISEGQYAPNLSPGYIELTNLPASILITDGVPTNVRHPVRRHTPFFPPSLWAIVKSYNASTIAKGCNVMVDVDVYGDIAATLNPETNWTYTVQFMNYNGKIVGGPYTSSTQPVYAYYPPDSGNLLKKKTRRKHWVHSTMRSKKRPKKKPL